MNGKQGWIGVRALLLAMLLLVPSVAKAQQPAKAPLVASGTLRARQVRVASQLGGRILQVRAQEGDPVRRGDLLVELDAQPLLLELAQAEAAVATARADLAAAKAGASLEEVAAAQAELAVAQAERDGALAAWQHAQAQLENPQELERQLIAARTAVALAAQNTEGARADLTAQQILRDHRKQGGSDLRVRAAEAALAAAEAEEGAAQAALAQLNAIRQEPLGLIAQERAAAGRYRVAEAGVTVAEAKLADLRAGPSPQAIAVVEATVRLAEARVRVMEAQLAEFALTSPLDGVVLERMLQPGEIAGPAATVLTLADLSTLTLDVYVPANRVGEVVVASEARVSVKIYPERVFVGRVLSISDEPEFTPRNVTTQEERLNTFYVVQIRVPNAEGLLKSGMPAEAVF